MVIDVVPEVADPRPIEITVVVVPHSCATVAPGPATHPRDRLWSSLLWPSGHLGDHRSTLFLFSIGGGGSGAGAAAAAAALFLVDSRLRCRLEASSVGGNVDKLVSEVRGLVQCRWICIIALILGSPQLLGGNVLCGRQQSVWQGDVEVHRIARA